MSSARWHRGRCRSRAHLLDQHGSAVLRTTAPSSAPISTEESQDRSFRRADTFTPKQIQLDKKNGKLYWCDREGMRVMRCNLDGSQIETLVETGRGEADRRDQTRWCVGIAIDPERGQIYWTQKGPDNGGARPHLSRRDRYSRKARLRPIAPTSRSSTIVCRSRSISSSISKNRVLYWTDRGDPPRGNTVNRASIDAKPQAPEIFITHLMEGHRHRARRRRRSHVRHRFRRLSLFRQARRIGRAQLPLRAGKSHRHRLRRNLKIQSKENRP